MPEMNSDEIVQAIQDLGLRICLFIFEGRHADAKRAAEVMIAQGELLRGMYADDMTPEELQMFQERLKELTHQ